MIPATANQKNDQRNERELPDKFEGWQTCLPMVDTSG